MINWNLLEEVRGMKKSFHLDAYAVDAVSQQGNPVPFDISDGCNGMYRIITKHDEQFVPKEQLIKVMQLLEQELANNG